MYVFARSDCAPCVHSYYRNTKEMAAIMFSRPQMFETESQPQMIFKTTSAWITAKFATIEIRKLEGSTCVKSKWL